MTYTITNQCISCQRCFSACPTGAIQTNGSTFWIEIDRCNQCQGSHSVPQCWAVCPTNSGCVPVTEGVLAAGLGTSTDYWATWFATYSRVIGRLKASQPGEYWQQWFETYSQKLHRLQTQYSH